MNTRSKSTLFLIEQLIVIAVFAISAAACITILTSAYFTSVESRDIKYAVLVAENVAETFKASNGSIDSVTRLLGGENYNTTATIYYNSKWQVSSENEASYILQLSQPVTTSGSKISIISSNINVSKTTGEEIISFPITVTKQTTGGEADE